MNENLKNESSIKPEIIEFMRGLESDMVYRKKEKLEKQYRQKLEESYKCQLLIEQNRIN